MMSLWGLVNDLMDERNQRSLYDQHFGLGLLNDEALRPLNSLLMSPMRCGYLRPWRSMAIGDSGISTIASDKTEFKVNLDVQQFKPEELKVKVVEDYLVIEGKHEERSDEHGFISRQFTRRYKIPQNVDQEAIESNLSSDGVLTLKAKKKVTPEAEGKVIPIIQSKQPAVTNEKDKKSEKQEEQMEQ
ncbi:alpha-crystallin A chain [Halyomorpha halys]|uniref:alpha-crystallin A chain n=1 Tax=Halyomorpha halys TaxID=286706 RepID=UPI0006D4DC01|nr:alpha-crystallin A chain-like [Halyomorpha halys]